MDTDRLIECLAAEAHDGRHRPGAGGGLAPRLILASLAGFSLVVALVLLGPGQRPDLLSVAWSTAGVLKFGGSALLCMLSVGLLRRLAAPEFSTIFQKALAVVTALGAALVIWSAATVGMKAAPLACVTWIVGLAAIPLPAILWVLRAGAPQRPGLLGGAAGVLAGSLAAFGFALHCPLDATASILLWYPVAIATVALASAGIGSRVLVW
jgi:hypothetical protein